MKLVKNILITIVLVFLLLMSIAAPIALIGVAIYTAGIWLSKQKQKGNVYFKKPWMVITAGIVGTLILVGAFAEESPEVASGKPKVENHQEKEEKAKKEEEKLLAEQKKKEAEEKAKQEEEAKAKAEAEAKAKAEAEAKAKAEAEAKAKAETEAKAKAEDEAKAKTQQEALITALALEKVTVGRVVDGDTIETTDGRKVRLIGVNTPESTTRHEPYGKEASNYTTSKLAGKQVWMQKDVSETDRYGRYLRIIWLAVPANDMNENEIRTKMFNAELVINGYAEPSTYPPDVKYSDYFVKFAREARESGTGLWAYGVNGTTKGDLDPKPAAKAPSTATSKPAPAKPASAPSTSTGQTEYFQNCTELRKKYPNGVPSTHPAYQPKMDRDKDNFACER